MTGWLNALGGFKWPSLILIASPVAAYPFWVAEEPPAADCGLVEVEGRPFRAYKREEAGQFVLRPAVAKERAGTALAAVEPVGFDSGGMVVAEEALPGLDCGRAKVGAQGASLRP